MATKDDYLKKLETASKLTQAEAKKELLEELDRELVSEKAKRIRQMEENLKLDSQEIAKEILVDAMRHGAGRHIDVVGMPGMEHPHIVLLENADFARAIRKQVGDAHPARLDNNHFHDAFMVVGILPPITTVGHYGPDVAGVIRTHETETILAVVHLIAGGFYPERFALGNRQVSGHCALLSR